jgi:hypothetical protein
MDFHEEVEQKSSSNDSDMMGEMNEEEEKNDSSLDFEASKSSLSII